MLLIDARVGPSSIHGLGLIAREAVAAGATISRFEAGLDLALSQEELDGLPGAARRAYRYYSFRHVHTGKYVLSFDDDRFTNHSNDPNTDGRRALGDIAVGEEITYDYRRWDLDCEWKVAGTEGSFANTLRGGDRAGRLAVLKVICEVGLLDKSVVGLVGEGLSDADREVRYYAAKGLARVGGADAGAAAGALGRALRSDPQGEVRYFAAKCLSRIGAAGAGVMDDLVRGLGDGDGKVRYYCAKGLGSIGGAARGAVGRLRGVMAGDGEAEVREAAGRAVGRIGGGVSP